MPYLKVRYNTRTMKITVLGQGAWGFCLASLLAENNHTVTCWSIDPLLVNALTHGEEHPFLKGHTAKKKMRFTTDLEEALFETELIVESVTSAGLRNVLEKVKATKLLGAPIVITSKGIEQNSGKILPEVAIEVLGESYWPLVGILSGPSFAEEVIKGLPTSVVAAAYNLKEVSLIAEAFNSKTFRVYPNSDVRGVAFGGALKNIIAIACGVSTGLKLGESAKAALITRGLHEIRKLAVASDCKPETLNGLSGLGDLCLTCGSSMSRNFRFGELLAKGSSPQDSKKEIKMVVEGAYTAVSALQLSKKLNVSMPITETVYKIIYEELLPKDAVLSLMQRAIKEEHL